MILQSLNAYYDRLLSEGKVQSTGFQAKAIRWIVTLADDGSFVGLTRTGEEKGKGKQFVVPTKIRNSAEFAANPLWDNAEYVFGLARPDLTEQQHAKVPRRQQTFLAFVHEIEKGTQHDIGVSAVLKFLSKGDWSKIEKTTGWGDISSEGDISFRLDRDEYLVCERPAVKLFFQKNKGHTENNDASALCLVTGCEAKAARLHTEIKWVRFAHTKGAPFVSFNLPASTSHGWEQGENAPISEAAAHGYATALNHLLAREQDRYHHVEGDTTFVFWATGPTPLEDHFLGWLTGRASDEGGDDGEARVPGGEAVKNAFKTIMTGLIPFERDRTPFCILGLAPNVTRLAVRFWHQGTVEGVAQSIRQHFADLDIDGLWENGKAPGLWQLLGAAARGGDAKQLQDQLRGHLSAELVVAILENTPYPATLFARTIERVKAEQSVWPLRAAIIKASLIRRSRSEEEITVSLDENNTNAGYRLGRLFSVLEGIQQTSQGKNKTNITIRDRYFAAAMSSPRAVFPQLIKLKNAHLKKLTRDKVGLAIHFDKLVNDIFDALPASGGLPPYLSLDDQGRFILGYHHQRNAWRHQDDDAAGSIDE